MFQRSISSLAMIWLLPDFTLDIICGKMVNRFRFKQPYSYSFIIYFYEVSTILRNKMSIQFTRLNYSIEDENKVKKPENNSKIKLLNLFYSIAIGIITFLLKKKAVKGRLSVAAILSLVSFICNERVLKNWTDFWGTNKLIILMK